MLTKISASKDSNVNNKKPGNATPDKYSNHVIKDVTISTNNVITTSPYPTTKGGPVLTNINVYKVLEKPGISVESQ